MGFSLKRARAVAQGKVLYCVMLDDVCVFSDKSFLVALQTADNLQKANPDKKYTFTIKEDL